MTYKKSDEQALDSFINDLTNEKEPGVYSSGAIDPELEKMFETVRAVKRNGKSGVNGNKFYNSRFFRGLAVAAAAVIIAIGLSVMELPFGGKQPGIVQAFVRAYEDLQGYSGVFEIRSERNEEVEFRETIEISYEKPGRYHAVHRFSGFEMRYVSDGDRMVADELNTVTVENLFPEKELWRYHIGLLAGELQNAEEVKVLDEEILFGRVADVLEYRYADAGPQETNFVWIDRETNLPLRKVLINAEGRLVVEFKELTVNPEFEPDTFTTVIPEEKEVIELNRAVNIGVAERGWPGLEKVIDAVPEEMKLYKTGLLENDFYEYVLRFRTDEYEYLDIYYAATPRDTVFMPDSKAGLLGGGYAELNASSWNVFDRYIGGSRIARWISGDGEIFMVSSRNISFLQELLEKIAQDRIEVKSLREMEELGIEIAVEKEGH